MNDMTLPSLVRRSTRPSPTDQVRRSGCSTIHLNLLVVASTCLDEYKIQFAELATGARFGPRAIRAASARQLPGTSYNARAGINPYLSWATVTDCGDIPITPFDNALAARQMYEAFLELGSRPAKTAASSPSSSSGSDSEIDGNIKGISAGRPKLITLGGDHSVALPALRALYKIYNKPITVVHFDAHLDTWDPTRYTSHWLSEQSHFNHGSFFHIASREGLICNKTSVHAGLRTRLTGIDDGDYTNPGPEQGFLRIHADDIDEMNGGAAIRGGDDGGVSGPVGIANRIINRVGLDPDQPVYLSVDIDVLDPSTAPGTGTPEPGGWTTREFIRILRGIEKLNIVGADIVEVSPSYDNKGETTALAAAQVAFEIVTTLVKAGVARDLGGWYGRMEQQKPQQQQQRHEAESERTVKSDGGKDEL